MVYQSTRLGGISEGIAGLDDLRTKRAENRKKRAEARQKQMEADIELANREKKEQLKQSEIDNKIAVLESEAAAAKERFRISEMDSMLNRYYADFDSRHFNDYFDLMNSNPLLESPLFKTVNNATNLSNTQENLKLLIEQGVDNEVAERIVNTPELANQFVVLSHANGNKGLLNVDEWAIGGGFFRRQDNNKIELSLKRAELLKASAEIADWTAAQELIDKGLAGNLAEALGMVEEAKNEGKALTPTELEQQKLSDRMDQTGETLSQASDWLANLGGTGPSPGEQAFQQLIDEGMSPVDAHRKVFGRLTSTQKELVQANEIRENLENTGIYERGFDMNKLPEKEQNELKGKVFDLMALTGNEITDNQRKFLRELGPLVNLAGEVAEDLTPVQTGLLDNFLSDVMEYISNNVKGVNPRSAYLEFRNLSRHILMGNQLTSHEIEAYNQASGWLGQKFVPVMEQFLVKLETHKNRLEALSNITEPAFVPVFLGKTSGQLKNISDQIQMKIDFYKGKLGVEAVTLGDVEKETTTETSTENLDSLEDKFNL